MLSATNRDPRDQADNSIKRDKVSAMKKRMIAGLLCAVCVFTLTACGSKELAIDWIGIAEGYGKHAGQVNYLSRTHVRDVVVALPMEDKTVTQLLEDSVGKLEYYTAEDYQAIVLEKNEQHGDAVLLAIAPVEDPAEDDSAGWREQCRSFLRGSGSHDSCGG